MIKFINNFVLLIIIFIANLLIENYNHYFFLIYIGLATYHIYIFLKLYLCNYFKSFASINYILISLLLFIITYFIICDSNPFFCLIAFYIFYPNFIKASLIIFIHSYIIHSYIKNINENSIIKSKMDLTRELPIKLKKKIYFISSSFFLSDIFNKFKIYNNYRFYFFL